jgi:hypothetical protein
VLKEGLGHRMTSRAETRERRIGDKPIGCSGRTVLMREQCNGFAESIARQGLGKHAQGNAYAIIGCPVLGNVAVTSLDNNSDNRKCFLCSPCRVYITRVCLQQRGD